jgi:hypothetical protein
MSWIVYGVDNGNAEIHGSVRLRNAKMPLGGNFSGVHVLSRDCTCGIEKRDQGPIDIDHAGKRGTNLIHMISSSMLVGTRPTDC